MELSNFLSYFTKRKKLFTLLIIIIPALAYAAHRFPSDAYFEGAVNIQTATGVDVNPGSDTAADLLSVGVTGSPIFGWDETNDGFTSNKSLLLTGDMSLTSTNGIDINPGSDTDADLLTVGVTGSPTLSWDETANGFRVDSDLIIGDSGSGTHTVAGAALTSSLEVHSDGGTDLGGLAVHRHASSATLGAHLLGLKSRGSHASPTVVQDGDVISRYVSAGYDGTDYEVASEIRTSVDGTPGAGDMPGRIGLWTTPDGSGTQVEALRIDSGQNTNIMSQKELRFQDSTGGEYMGFKAPTAVTSSTTLTLPDGDGSSGQAIVTNGSGALSFATIGGSDLAVSTKTGASFSAATGNLYLIDTTSNDVTANLPAAASYTGEQIVFKVINNTNSFIADGNASETIDGSTTFELNGDDEFIAIRSDGTNWQISASGFNEYLSSIISSATATSTADTYISVTGSTVSIPSAGTWTVGYDVTAYVSRVSAAQVVLGGVRLYDTTNSATLTGSTQLVGQYVDATYDRTAAPASKQVEITTTGPADIELQIRCNQTNTYGTIEISQADIDGGFAAPDMESAVWARRTK